MTMLVRDEADILDENIRFHLANGVDYILILDNLSTDATAEIANRYVRSGHAHYEFQPNDIYAQSRWVTAMARRAYTEFGADWVINSDADEFWLPRHGSLKDVLSDVPAGIDVVTAERSNFVPRHEHGEPFWKRMDVRWVSSCNALGDPLPPKAAHRGRDDVEVAFGNHAATFGGVQPESHQAEIDILHFPVRTRRQYENKIVNGAQALANNHELPPEIGRTWRQLYECCKNGDFQRVWERECLSESDVAAGLALGTLVRDERLMRALDTAVAHK